jgi:FkbM family methyltransferase
LLLILLTGLVIGIVGATVLFTAAAEQTRAYYAFQRWWHFHWPFPRGRGIARLTRPILKKFVPVWVQIEPQVKMLLDSNDLISRVILETGVWDEATWLAIQRQLSGGATFVDIGAHEGYCSLKAARIVGPNGRVLAIEPNPEMVRVLRDNVLASAATVISIEPLACSDSEAVADLFVAGQFNTGSSSLSETNAGLGGAVRTTYRVPTCRVDSIVQRSGVSRVDVVKIDVEGSEFQVLKGAQETLARYRPVLVVELDDVLLNTMATNSAEIIAFLESLQYRLHGTYDQANFEFRPE